MFELQYFMCSTNGKHKSIPSTVILFHDITHSFRSKGSANFVMKWKESKRDASISFTVIKGLTRDSITGDTLNMICLEVCYPNNHFRLCHCHETIKYLHSPNIGGCKWNGMAITIIWDFQSSQGPLIYAPFLQVNPWPITSPRWRQSHKMGSNRSFWVQRLRAFFLLSRGVDMSIYLI